jgi:hypothetical protein
MIKRFLIMCLIGFTLVNAQEKRSLNVFAGHQQLSIGSSSDFSSGTYFGVSKNIGFLFMNSPLNFGFQFSERGGENSIDLNEYLVDGNSSIDDNTLDVIMRHSYFDFFVNANFSLGNTSIYFGPMVGFNITSDSGLQDVVLPAIYDLDSSEFDAKQFDWGMNYGITFHVNRFVGISLESYQGMSEEKSNRFKNYGLKLSVGI